MIEYKIWHNANSCNIQYNDFDLNNNNLNNNDNDLV